MVGLPNPLLKSVPLLVLVLLAACGALSERQALEGEIYSQLGVSRSYSYIVLAEPGDEYVTKTAVGGEHINIQELWAFRGQEYLVYLDEYDRGVGLSISGENVKIAERTENGKDVFDIIVDVEDAIITISQHAYPDGNYTLVILRKN